MPARQDIWLVAEDDRLVVVPDLGGKWQKLDYANSTWSHRGVEYRDPQYASEWLALSDGGTCRPIGIFFEMVMAPELNDWLNRGFANVRRIRVDAYYILLTEGRNLQEEGWPFLPCEALRSESGDYAIWVPDFYHS